MHAALLVHARCCALLTTFSFFVVCSVLLGGGACKVRPASMLPLRRASQPLSPSRCCAPPSLHRRQGAEAARRDAAEAVLAAEEKARQATLAAEAKAIKLQAELDALQRRLEEAERATMPMPVPAQPYEAQLREEEDGDEDEEQVENAVRRVEAVYRQELEEREWARRAVSAAGELPELPDGHTLLSASAVGDRDAAGEQGGALSELVKWVCVEVPSGGGRRRRSVLMDTPYGRFAVLIPPGLAPGTPLLVPVPASGEPNQIGMRAASSDPVLREKEAAKEAQLAALIERGFPPSEAAQYCDGTSSLEALVELMSSDDHALEELPTDADIDAGEDEVSGAGSHRRGADRTGGGSNFCIVS